MNFFEAKEGFSSSIEVTPEGVTLSNRPARFIKLSNWNVADDNENFPVTPSNNSAVEEAAQEVFWGFNGDYAHQLFPSRETELIPITNLRDISLRCRANQTVKIRFSYWT